MQGRGDKIFTDTAGEVDEFEAGTERRTHVRFPVCLDIRWGDTLAEQCVNFSMNVSRGGVFVQTTSPLAVRSKVKMEFYIPPAGKLLCECSGVVVAVNTDSRLYPCGMHVKFTDYTDEGMQRLVDYLEEKRHLVDEEA